MRMEVGMPIDEFCETGQSTVSDSGSTSAGGEGGRDGMEHGCHLISKLLESEWAKKQEEV